MDNFPVCYSTLSTSALLELLVSKYGIDKQSSPQLLKRGFNDTYLITTKKEGEISQKFILRNYKHRRRSFESIVTEVNALLLLKEKGVSISVPIADNQGNYIQNIQAPEGIRYAVLFSFAEGDQIRKLSSEQAFLLGTETGKLHSITKNKTLGICAQNYDIGQLFNIILNTLNPILVDYPEQYQYMKQLQNEFMNVFKDIDKNEVPIGICHGDLHAENVHFSNTNQITFFDFDFFGEGYLIYDIGVFMWYDHKNKPPEIIKAFLKGYQTERKLSETELKLLPHFSTLRAVFQMNLFCTISDGEQLPLWPAKEVAAFIDKVKNWKEKSLKIHHRDTEK